MRHGKGRGGKMSRQNRAALFSFPSPGQFPPLRMQETFKTMHGLGHSQKIIDNEKVKFPPPPVEEFFFVHCRNIVFKCLWIF